MRNPLVAVLLPCYGSLPYIQETIESLMQQTFSDFEVVIINDRIASEDLEYVKGLARLDSRFRVLESEGHGISAALNTGIASSNSSLIARIDADDKMDPKRLEVQSHEIELNGAVLCVGSQLKLIDNNGGFIRYTSFPESPSQIRKMMDLRNVVAHPSVLFRKDAILKVGSYRSFFDGAEDYDLWLRLLNSGEILNLHEPLTTYRIHASQETRNNKEIQQELDSFTRFYAKTGGQTLNSPQHITLKSLLIPGTVRSVNFVKNSTLPKRVQKTLLGASYLNAAMSNPSFMNLLKSMFVFVYRPELFYLALKYSLTRWTNASR